MSEKTVDFNALGNVINSSWGKSSAINGCDKTVKISLKSDKYIEIVYCAVVNMTTDHLARDMSQKYCSMADDVIKLSIDRIKKEYKELTDSSLKVKIESDNHSVEFINLNMFNRKRTAYFRRNVICTIE
jgi:hypothetical protein